MFQLHHNYHCCVYREKLMMDRGTVEFQSRNKFEKLVHLVGFIIQIYHDAQSLERQFRLMAFCQCTRRFCIMCVTYFTQITVF
jgi:hypothetical protein